MIGLGFMAKLLVGFVWDLNGVSAPDLMVPMIGAFIIYSSVVAYSIWMNPWLIGMEKADLCRTLSKFSTKSGHSDV